MNEAGNAVDARNRIVTRTSSTCFHNYDLFKIRIGARSESRVIVAEHATATTNRLENRQLFFAQTNTAINDYAATIFGTREYRFDSFLWGNGVYLLFKNFLLDLTVPGYTGTNFSSYREL